MRQPDHPWKKARFAEHNHPPQARPGNQIGRGEVPVENLRAAFRKSGLSKSELARRLGWSRLEPDLHRVNMILGFEKQSNGKAQQLVSYDLALRLARAMNADLQEVGV